MTVQKNDKRAELMITGISRMRLCCGVGYSTPKILGAGAMSGLLVFYAEGGMA
jgi:hypothetical protein